MDTSKSLLRFHDANVAWMLEYFLSANTETRDGAFKQLSKGCPNRL